MNEKTYFNNGIFKLTKIFLDYVKNIRILGGGAEQFVEQFRGAKRISLSFFALLNGIDV